MKLILLGQRDSNYDNLIDFCSSRGIELVEEKFTSTNKQMEGRSTDGHSIICPTCGSSNVQQLPDGNRKCFACINIW